MVIKYLDFALLWGFVSSLLIILSIFCAITYYQSKQKSFLYYFLYNFFLLTNLLSRSPFFDDFLRMHYYNTEYYSYSIYCQVIYNSCLFFFYREFLDIKNYNPGFYKVLTRSLQVLIVIGTVLFLHSVAIDNDIWLRGYFFWIFLPIILILTIYALYIAWFIPNRLGYFIIVGVILYNILAYTALIETFKRDGGFVPMNYFLIGIIIESLVFMLGIGYKIRLVYQEKIRAQEEIGEKLKAQADELKSALHKSEEEKLLSLTNSYETEISILKLESLRSQMNPHFIFNALNSIKVYLIENDKEKAIYYLNKFSKLIRKILESSRTDSISLAEELDILELYMNIENIRFEKKIDFTIETTTVKNLNTIKLPGLVLQPFIENSLWHGLMLKEGEKFIRIQIYDCNHDVVLTVTDNGIGRRAARENVEKKSFKKESLGLLFTNERLQSFNNRYDKDYSFSITDLMEDGEPAGTRVEFVFPKV